MDNDAKVSRYNDPAKMRKFTMYMEQFWALATDPALDEDHRKAARAMYDHYKRMTLCMAAKEMPHAHNFDRVIDVEYMKNMYKKYEESAS